MSFFSMTYLLLCTLFISDFLRIYLLYFSAFLNGPGIAVRTRIKRVLVFRVLVFRVLVFRVLVFRVLVLRFLVLVSGRPYEASNTSSRSGEKILLEIQFHQPSKIVNGLIQSDIPLQVAANEGIRETYNPQSQDITEPVAFFVIAKNPTIVRAAQLAVLALLKQPEEGTVAN